MLHAEQSPRRGGRANKRLAVVEHVYTRFGQWRSMEPPRTSPANETASEPHLVALFDEGDAEGIRKISVAYNIGLLPRPIHDILQEILDYVEAVATATIGNPNGDKPDAELWLRFSPAKARAMEGDALREGLNRWVARAAFADAVESAHMALEGARLVLSIRNLRGKVPAEDFGHAIGREAERFHGLPLQKKLDQLSKTYGLHLDQSWQDVILSLNALRNCVVHRFGNVGPKDVGDQSFLKASWESHRFVASGANGDRLLRPGDMVSHPESLVVQRGPGGREFPLESTVDLSLRDVHEICFTIHRFAQHVQHALRPLLST
jgi:hypothetical protein